MFSKSFFAFIALSVLSFSEVSLGRERWLEKDGRAVHLYPRRFGQENPAVIGKLGAACPGQVCGVLSGQAITPLLAAQPECSQQDMADAIIDAAQQFDAATKANMIALAIEYRQAEKNTPPDFTTNPPTARNSVFCQKAPKNAELNGLVQAQDPANDPNIFFDPATKASVSKGSQPNTFPFGTSGSSSSDATSGSASSAVASSAVASATISSVPVLVAASSALAANPCAVTVTVSAVATDATATATESAVTVTVGNVAASTAASVPVASSTASSTAIGNFGSCSVPQIEFGVGFDNRKETSFQPVDKTSYNHGSAQNIDIITQFICDTLVNTCGADQTAKDTCANAKAAADTVTTKTGGQADAFNAVFGITTQFVQVVAVDDQGRVVGGTGSAASTAASIAVSSAASSAASSTSASSAAAASPSASASSGSGAIQTATSTIGDFGKCTVPQIEFAVGFDNRKETSFQPVDKTSYNHGSAQNIDIITQFMCDTLVNSCGADQTAKDTCAKAQTAADTVTAKTGGQADAFNNVFNIQTNFAAVAAVDNQGNVIAGTGSASGSAAVVSSSAQVVATSTNAASAAASSAASTSSGANLQTFTGALGGVTAPVVNDIGGGNFQVVGNSQFNNLSNALTRSCDVQHNQCANAANASGNKGDLTVAACGDQQTQCNASHQ